MRYSFRVTTETTETLTDRQLMERMARQLDHLDEQLHEVRQFIDQHRPALDKAMKLMDNPVAKYLEQRKAARHG